MSAKKSAAKPAKTQAKADPDTYQLQEGLDGVTKDMNWSQALAALATRSAFAAETVKVYSNAPPDLALIDLVDALRLAGQEVNGGNLERVERMLVNQAITLDNIFNRMAQRSAKQEYVKQMETYLRLALKAQTQARSTIEAIALLKNPQPYIRQANIAAGNQQVNNHAPGRGNSEQYAQARAGESSSAPNKLLEADHAQRLDIGAQAAAGRADQELETVGAVNRA